MPASAPVASAATVMNRRRFMCRTRWLCSLLNFSRFQINGLFVMVPRLSSTRRARQLEMSLSGLTRWNFSRTCDGGKDFNAETQRRGDGIGSAIGAAYL